MAAQTNGQSNGLYTYDSFGGKKRKTDSHFLWWCAGAHQKLLQEYPSEHTKYAGLGGVILATFVLAALSSGYAVYSVFNNWSWAIAFAIIWGMIIFNFDRFLVSTMRKYGVSVKKQVWMTIPRITLAILIGVTIARPLELKIFEKEIDVKVLENRHKKIALNDSLLEAEHKKQIESALTERARLTQRKLELEDTLHRLQQAYVQEADGTGGSMQRGIEKLTLLKQETYNNAMTQFAPELALLKAQIQSQDSILSTAKASFEKKRTTYESGLADKVGFLERNKALTDLSNQESSVYWANFFIFLLIILIETGPILSKLIMPLGPYDLALAKDELMQMAESENEMRRDAALQTEKLEGLIQRRKELSTETQEKFSRLQKKYIDEELAHWEMGEKISVPRTSMNDLAKKIKDQYDYAEKHVI
ncbi:MAG: DUF4407 domain-containing protein [Chitinophagales bacterium]